MINQITFTSSAFGPTTAELDEDNEEYINPGIYALALADFLAAGLSEHGYPIRFRCQEDWGHWMEIEHSGDFKLAIGCANVETDDGDADQHRIIIMKPAKPVVRKLFRKIDVREPVGAFLGTICEILENDSRISDLHTEAA